MPVCSQMECQAKVMAGLNRLTVVFLSHLIL